MEYHNIIEDWVLFFSNFCIDYIYDDAWFGCVVEFSVSHMIRKAKNPNPPQTDLSICLFLSILLSSDPKLIITPWCPTTSQTNPFHYTSLFLCLSVFLFCTVTIGTVVSATPIISTKILFLFLYYLCFFIVFLFLYFFNTQK